MSPGPGGVRYKRRHRGAPGAAPDPNHLPRLHSQKARTERGDL